MVYFMSKERILPMVHPEEDGFAISVLPAGQMDTQAVLGRLHELVWLRHRCFPARLYGIAK